MKKLEPHNLAAEFNPAARSDPNPVSAARLRARAIDALEELKQRLLLEIASCSADPATFSSLQRAAEDAASLAWTTPFPLLVLPELFSEKAAEACIRSQRQRDIRRRSLRLIGLDD